MDSPHSSRGSGQRRGRRAWREPLLTGLAGLAVLGAPAAGGAAAPAVPAALAAPTAVVPASVHARLSQAGLGDAALAVVVQPVEGGEPRLSWQAELRRPAASLMKLFTTYAALERLGPAWVWRTPVWLNGKLTADGVLQGDLVIQGVGDPSLSAERLWLLLQEVQRRGVRRIDGDIVLDDRGFEPAADAGAFDGEPLKPYNVPPHGLLFALGSVSLGLHPQPDGRWARVEAWPALADVRWPQRVALGPGGRQTASADGACGDWQRALQLDLSRPNRPQLRGQFPAACGEREWHLAWPDEADHARRLIAATWRQSGGKLRGQVRESRTGDPHLGAASATGLPAPSFWFDSPPLAEVVRSTNKFSNNLMARQLFLSLGRELSGDAGQPNVPPAPAPTPDLPPRTPGIATLAAARQVVAAHARERAGCGAADLLLDNGAGLSRVESASAACLGRLLRSAWASPVMPELMASLPIAAVDGTTRRMNAAPGRAHLKTGTLNDVAGIAGYVLGDSGRRWIVVGVISGADAPAARGALDALVAWVADDLGSH